MRNAPSMPSHSRLIAVGLLVALLVLLVAAVALPLSAAKGAAQEQLDDMVHRLDKYRGIAAGKPGLEQQYTQLQAQYSVDDAYLNQETTALAIAALQGIAKRRIAAAGGVVSSMQANPVREEDGFIRVSISVKMRAPQQSLVKCLHALENGRPSLFLGGLMLRRLTSGAAFRSNPNLQMDVRFDLAGYMKAEGV
ncbi:type II secretion system protein GspM [Motiliproteus sp. SC1-56]|uniref:type II secretion system protein GspM n=1 Tax=Motiliproteus sp. SC1-56 TaxID=2799565 RepID=UPI001A8CFE53|nr:type II secretion system protein GspM [Motiliproteus sp. SC1-56]